MNSPYINASDTAFWRKSINQSIYRFDTPFKLKSTDKIMTIGSCFARRVMAELKNRDCNVLITEDLHPGTLDLIPIMCEATLFPFYDELLNSKKNNLRAKYNYGIFTARYDDIYNSGQLNQLLHRALGKTYQETIWQRQDGRYVDAFRPKINPEGFITQTELMADREYHLQAVKKAFLELDVLIFTFGIAETWHSKIDGAIYPIAPGVVGDTFDPNRHGLNNFRVADLIRHFNEFYQNLKEINPKAKVILTVSPTPLIATATSEHIISANMRNKSVLRAACAEIVESHNSIAYFPAYDLALSGAFLGKKNFEDDWRTPTKEFISQIMDIFFASFFEATQSTIQKTDRLFDLSTINHDKGICDDIISQK